MLDLHLNDLKLFGCMFVSREVEEGRSHIGGLDVTEQEGAQRTVTHFQLEVVKIVVQPLNLLQPMKRSDTGLIHSPVKFVLASLVLR